jgi:hypothetical protein
VIRVVVGIRYRLKTMQRWPRRPGWRNGCIWRETTVGGGDPTPDAASDEQQDSEGGQRLFTSSGAQMGVWAGTIPGGNPGRSFHWPLCCRRPLAPRLSRPTEEPQHHHQTHPREPEMRFLRLYIHKDPAYRHQPRFFGRKTASTALQTLSRCEGGWGWETWLQHGTALLVRPA